MGRVRATSAMACLLFTLLLAEIIYVSAAEVGAVVSTIPIFPQIPSNQGRKDFQVLVSVQAPKESRGPIPIHLIFVYSVNSSELLTEVKKAIEFISGQLLGTGVDLLSTVGPSLDGKEPIVDTLSTPSDAKTKEVFKAQGTTFEDLLKEAMDIETGPERAGVVIVLTDGSQGPNDDNAVVKLVEGCSYPVHTVGLGAKHDPKTLHRIASATTGGTYSFVDDANVGKISAALAVCVAGLRNVVVPGTSAVRLKAAAGVKIKKIQYGVSADNPTNTEYAEIKIGMLHVGETKKILVHIDVEAEGNRQPPPEAQDHSGGCGEKTLLAVSFFRSTSDTAPTTTTVLCVERPQAAVQAAAPSPLVLQQIVTLELIPIMIDLSYSATSGVVLANQLELRWGRFVQDYQYWIGMDVLLGGLQQEINAMKLYATSYSAFSVAYINSWLSSYGAQRPTAMGSSSNVVGAFITQEVNIMVEVALQISNNKLIHPGIGCLDQHNCFDADELAHFILEALRDKKLHGKPCREINAELRSRA